jgi:hypothetical protein
VLSGSIAVFHLPSGKTEEHRYWDWLERQVDPGTEDISDLGEQFLDRPRAAIRTRLRGREPILAAAMRGVLPECILNRPRKGHFNEAYYMGLSRNLRRLEALVEQAPVDDLGFLDKPSLLDCLQRAALGNAGDAGALLQFEGTLSLLLWLTLQQRETPQSRQAESADAASMAA